MTRLRVVDNSEIGKRAMAEGRPPKCIHVYNKTGVGKIGDKVLVAIKGEKKKGVLVGLKQNQKCKVPKFDSNNLVLIDDNGTPLGTRIHSEVTNRDFTQEKNLDIPTNNNLEINETDNITENQGVLLFSSIVDEQTSQIEPICEVHPSTREDGGIKEGGEHREVTPPREMIKLLQKSNFRSPEEFKGYPKAASRKNTRKNRKKGRSFIPTDTPEKTALEEKEKEKERKFQLNKTRQVKRKIVEESESSAAEDEMEFSDNSLDSVEWYDKEPPLFLAKQLEKSPEINDYVLVEFVDKAKSKKIYYAGQITETIEGEYKVKFLRRSSKYQDSFIFPVANDISLIKEENIKFILSSPKCLGSTKRQKAFMKFEINFQGFKVR
ncbi:hypothetical protein RN001_003388 [Aquatica leii]|uniref:Large ribosomal subunit protein uL14m n=1 Tax=Aquatica leii TaxID=1421715 RepID=A0AAN7SKQ7_9COLE|nr:hypothetical protein RN001_003388 [Aquatica leii]